MSENSKINTKMYTDPLQKKILNVYCDESCHLENDGIETMGWGAFLFPKTESNSFKDEIKSLKSKHDLAPDFEIKWNKVSMGKIKFYLDLVDLYFKNPKLEFRCLIVNNKSGRRLENFGKNHNKFYYDMYYHLLNKILNEESVINIYLDKKDTVGSFKVAKLHGLLCDNAYDFERKILNKVQIDSSHKSIGIQMADFLLGAVVYANRMKINDGELASEGKIKIIEKIREKSGETLTNTTLTSEYKKVNMFLWEMQ